MYVTVLTVSILDENKYAKLVLPLKGCALPPLPPPHYSSWK